VTEGEQRPSFDASPALDAAARRVEAGDHAAFAVIVRETTPRLYRLAARIMADSGEAEDVLQDAYVRAFDALVAGRFDGRAGIATWIYRIVANTALDALRARRRRRQQAFADDSADAAVDDAARLAARAALRELGGLLEDLPADQRAAVVLKEIEGLTLNEVAEVMGCSVGAVEQRLVRARATLRRRNDSDGG
jgi:RNA polymerase sigma-70 factor, ECF subfamily